MTAERKAQLEQAATICLDARRTGQRIENLPAALQATSLEEAYVVQDTMIKAYLPIGGWKIGGPPTADPFFAPMPAAWIAASGSTLKDHNFRAVEAEIAFRLNKDLPPRSTPYTREEIITAIASCHPAVEVLEMAFSKPEGVEKFVLFSDMQQHGGFIYGAAFADWQKQDWADESVTLTVDGAVLLEKKASNPAGTDLVRLLIYLANEGAARTGGLKKGDWITTGSWTGNTPVSETASVNVKFAYAGEVNLRFA
jgi:2-keto-4-pentenoate hydratase